MTEVLWMKMLAMLEEASWTIVRTSLSPTVRDSFDFGCLVYDVEGHLVAQNTTVAAKIGVYHTLLPEILKHYPISEMKPADIFVANDPWSTEGHLYDVSVVTPVFHRERVVAFAECIAHLADIGGSLSSTVADIFGEGLQIPPCRLARDGKENDEIVRVIEMNVRAPDLVMADLRALMNCVILIGRKCTAILLEHELDNFDKLFLEMRMRAERAIRAGIASNLRPGSYVGEVHADGDTEEGIVVRVTATVESDSLMLDFTGSSQQAKIGINACFNYSYAWAVFAIRTLTDASIPHNSGCYAPVRMFAPAGTVVNPVRPAPVRNRAATAHFVPQAVYAALSAAAKDRAIAQSGSPLWVHRIVGNDAMGRRVAGTIVYNGGMGARSGADGPSVTSFPTNAANTPIEVLESWYPVRFSHKALSDASGGPGTYRGGRGQRVGFRVLPGATLRLLYMHERTRHSAQGVLGGGSGRAGSARLNGTTLPSHGELLLSGGDLVELETPGGGGIGDPESTCSA